MDLEDVPHIAEGRDLETVIVASIQTLKRNNKKRGKKEVLYLVQESLNGEVTDRIFMTSPQKGGGGVLKFVSCLRILLFLNNISNVHS